MKRSICDRWTKAFLIAAAVIFAAASAGIDTKTEALAASVSPAPAATPIYTGYKGVKVGMTDEEARKLLGAPKEKSDTQDYFVFSDNETAQVVYDDAHKVTAVSVTYIGKSLSIPTPKAVFGEDAEAKPDGSISKTVRYPKEGFSVSYNRTAGDDPLVMITLQKIYGNPEG